MYELADAVVVGGGILGVALAAALSRRLSKVQLIEAGRCGTRATAGGFAWVNASSKVQDEAYHRLNAEGCRRHLGLAAERGQGRTGWNGGGSLFWTGADDPGGTAALDHKMSILQGWGYPVARLSRSEMQAIEPNIRFDTDAVGLFAPSEGWVNTALLTRFYLEEARENHADIAEFTRMTGFTLGHLGGIAGVETTNGRLSTRVVVICAGVETEGLLRSIWNASAGWTVSAPGLLAETGPVNRNALVHRVCFPPERCGLHLRPTADGGLLLGADDTDAIVASVNAGPDQPSELAAQSLVGRAAAFLPGLSSIEPAAARRCIRPVPVDGLPVVGAVPGLTGAHVLVTHSGVTLGPLLAQLLADEILTGRISPWLERYRPDRFFQ